MLSVDISFQIVTICSFAFSVSRTYKGMLDRLHKSTHVPRSNSGVKGVYLRSVILSMSSKDVQQ